LKINQFLDVKGNSFPQLTDHDWMHDFAFCVDITQYVVYELNNNFHGMNQLINIMSAKIKTFDCKLQLWELQLQSSNMAHFPTLGMEKPTETKK
jgi:hypothetical protein